MDVRGFGLSDDELRQLGYNVRESRRTLERAESTPAPRKPRDPAARTWVATLAVLGLVGWLSSSHRGLPAPVPAAGPDTAFSSDRALAQLVEVSQRPHPTGSPDNERVRGYLLGRLRSLGLEPELHTATSFVTDSTLVRAATVRNVVARVPGSGSTGSIVLSAHYDAAPLSPGAGDNGIGVATVLETVRAITSGAPLRNDVIVLLTDGDELGLMGSRAFADHPWMSDVAVVLSAEAVGVRGATFFFETGSENGGVIEALASAEPRPAALSLSRSVREAAVESAEADPLLQGSVVGVSLSPLSGAARQHQPGDTRDRVSARTLQHGGRQLLGLTRALGRLDLTTELAGPDRAYASLPWIGLVHVRLIWVLPVSLALVVLWGLVARVLRRRGGTRLGVLVAIGAGGAVLGGSAGLARTLRDLWAGQHGEYGFLRPAFYEDGLYVAAAAALALAWACAVYAVTRRWSRMDELVFGGLLIPLLYSVWLTYAEPFAAPALLLAAAPALLGGGLLIALGPSRARAVWAWAVLVPLSGLVLVFAVPSFELLAGAWTFRSAGTLGAVLGLGLLLLWPLMERLLMPRVWWTPLAAVGLATGLVLVTLATTRRGSAHPVPTTLVYLSDEPLAAAPLARGPEGAEADTSRVRSMVGKWLTVPGPGEEWARSWAGEPATGSTGSGVLLMGADARYEVVGTAPVSELAPPRVSVAASAVEGARRRVELSVEPGLAGEMTGVHIPEGSGGTIIGVGGRSWSPDTKGVKSLVHWGKPATETLRVDLEVDVGASSVELLVVEHHLRPREILGDYFFQRPDSMVANASLGSDRVVQRTRVKVPLGASVVDR
jgi:hypothetical protein